LVNFAAQTFHAGPQRRTPGWLLENRANPVLDLGILFDRIDVVNKANPFAGLRLLAQLASTTERFPDGK
jgi:hypothetical protein